MPDPRPLWKRLFIPDFKSRSSRVRVIISTPLAIMLISSMVTDTLAGSQYSFERTRYLMKRQ